MQRKLLGFILVGVMALSLCACGVKEESSTETETIAEDVQESSIQEESEPEITQEVGTEEQETQNEENLESEGTDENTGTSPLVGKTYKKDDGTTLEILSSDIDGYINAVKLNDVVINISNIQLLEGAYGPEENTYYGEFNDGIDRIGISYFTTDDTKLLIRLEISFAPDGATKEAEVVVTQDGTYYLE